MISLAMYCPEEMEWELYQNDPTLHLLENF